MPWIYSTLTADQMYTIWDEAPKGLELQRRSVRKTIFVKGGANVADKRQETHKGVRTRVSDEDVRDLKTIFDFQRHCDNGYITIRDDKVDEEVAVAGGMKQFDSSAPYTPERLHEELPKEQISKKTGEVEITEMTVKSGGLEHKNEFQTNIDRE